MTKDLLHTIWIYEAGLTPKCSVYTVVYNGAVLLEGQRDPEPSAARALEALGVTGVMIVRDAKTDAHRSSAVIAKAARLFTEESATQPLRTRKWRPMPTGLR